MTETYSPEEWLQDLTIFVSSYPKQVRFNTIGPKCTVNPTPFDHLKYCSQAFLSGALPNAATLAFIAFAFDKYIRSEGGLSLDEAFGLKPKPKAGKPAKQYARNNKVNSKLFDMAYLRASKPKLSIDNAALEVCEDADCKGASTLAREYKRQKWKKLEPIIFAQFMQGK